MRILVTGGVGFIGTNLIKRLLKEGHEVISIDNYSTGLRENEQSNCTYYEYNIESQDWWNIKPVDIIYHMAALARIQPSFNTPVDTFYSNVVATQNVLEWARKNNNIPVVYAGSSSIHGSHFANPYTFFKWQSEQVCLLYNKIWNLPVSICRFYNVYGPHQLVEGTYCTVIGIFERLYNQNKPLTITGDGEQRRDFTYVGDIIDGLCRCMKIEGVKSEIFEFGYGKNYSINEIANAFGKDYPTKYIEKRPGEMRETLNTDTKAQKVLGWRAKTDIIKFIKETYILDK